MSRISRYQDSIKKFIVNRNCYSWLDESPLKNFFCKNSKPSNYFFPILFLTILNSQNKKNRASYQGYYAAVSIEFIRMIIELTNNTNKTNMESYYKLIINLVLMTIKTLSQNIDVIKRHIPLDKILESYMGIINELVVTVGSKGIMADVKIVPSGKIKNDIYKYYFKENDKNLDKLSKIKVLDKKSLDKIINGRACLLSELTVSIAWILGCGNKDKMSEIKKVGRYFGFMYQLASDFQRVESDLDNIPDNGTDNTTLNYIINCGFQVAHESFMHYKEKFIEGLIKLDIYTGTVKELINLLEQQVDEIIDETTPDLSSNYSTLNTEYIQTNA